MVASQSTEEQSTHFWHEPDHLKSGFLQHPLRTRVLGYCEGNDFRQREITIRKLQAHRDELSGVTAAPHRGVKRIADFDAPAGIERVVVEPSPADDP
jgi:hypothetical protein